MQEAARLLGVPYDQFKLWVFERLAPSPSEWSRWNNEADVNDRNKSRPLPEAVIRLYLTWLRQLQPAPTPAELPVPPAELPNRAIAERRASKRGG